MPDAQTCPRCGEPERSRTDDSVTYLCGSYQFDGYAVSHSEQCDLTCLRTVERDLLHQLADAKDEVARLKSRAELAELMTVSAAYLLRGTCNPEGVSPQWAVTRDRWMSKAQGTYDNLS